MIRLGEDLYQYLEKIPLPLPVQRYSSLIHKCSQDFVTPKITNLYTIFLVCEVTLYTIY